MLKAYQKAFYNMVVHNTESELKAYTGSTLPWQTQVYQNNYKQSLLSSLGKTFKKMSEVIQQDQLQSLFIAFINENPSDNQNLEEYGYGLPDWICTHYLPEIKNRKMDSPNFGNEIEIPSYAVDLARIDVLLKQSYYSKNSVGFDGLAFSALTASQQVNSNFIRLNCIRVLKSEWNLEAALSQRAIARACDTKVGEGEGGDQTLDDYPLSPEESFYVIYRDQGLPKWTSIDQSVYKILQFLETTRSLQRISDLPELNSGINLPILIQKSWVTMQ